MDGALSSPFHQGMRIHNNYSQQQQIFVRVQEIFIGLFGSRDTLLNSNILVRLRWTKNNCPHANDENRQLFMRKTQNDLFLHICEFVTKFFFHIECDVPILDGPTKTIDKEIRNNEQTNGNKSRRTERCWWMYVFLYANESESES